MENIFKDKESLGENEGVTLFEAIVQIFGATAGAKSKNPCKSTT
jgi:hypothetical protein